MIWSPLRLEALALRCLIRERGINDDYSDLVPRMRKELEQLARLPGLYQVVHLQIDVKKEEDMESEILPYLKTLGDGISSVSMGDRVLVSWLAGRAGTMYLQQERPKQKLLGIKLSLDWDSVTKLNNGITIFKERFVEDGVFKSLMWSKRDEEGENAKEVSRPYRLDSFKLDPMGGIACTSHLYSHTFRETMVLTFRTKRVHWIYLFLWHAKGILKTFNIPISVKALIQTALEVLEVFQSNFLGRLILSLGLGFFLGYLAQTY